MAKLSGSLKDEEIFGGFDSDPNDDTFLLAKNMEYPGDIPEFDTPIETVTVERTTEEEQLEVNYEGVTKAPMISLGDQPGAESVWDMFDSPAQATVPEEQTEQITAVPSGFDADEFISEIPDDDLTTEDQIPLPEPELPEMQEGPAREDEFIPDEDVNFGIGKDVSDESDVIPDYEKEEIESDTLQETESYGTDPEISESTIDTPGQDEKFEIAVKELDEPSEETINKSIENIEEYEEISLDEDFKKQLLDDLENSRKKKRKDEQDDVIVKKVSLSEEEPVTEKITFGDYKAEHPSTFGIKGAEDEESSEDETEKRTRLVFPWKYIGYAAAVVLLVTGISVGGYYLVTQTDLFTASTEEESVPKKEQPAKAVTHSKIAAKPAKVPAKAEPKPEPKPDTAPKVIASEEVYKPVKPRWETTDVPEKKEHSVPSRKEKPPVKQITKATRQESPVKQSPSSAKEQIYTVELYSTPSAEDAKMWAQKLKNRNLDNINITQHKIRDKVIYKIRFGKYTTREEAKTEALKLGYPQTWVDRVK